MMIDGLVGSFNERRERGKKRRKEKGRKEERGKNRDSPSPHAVKQSSSDWKLWWSRFLLLSSELLVPKLGDLREI